MATLVCHRLAQGGEPPQPKHHSIIAWNGGLIGLRNSRIADQFWTNLLPSVLPHEEQVRLAKLALRAASRGDIQDRHTYQSVPPAADEFAVEEDPLAWEAEGWDEF
jgi:hypothetical protein